MARQEDLGTSLELVDWSSSTVSMALPLSSGRGPPSKALEQQRIITDVQSASGRMLFQRRLGVSLGEVPTMDRRKGAVARLEDCGASPAPPMSPPSLAPIVPAAPPPAATIPVTPTMGANASSPAPPTTSAQTEV